MDAMKKRCWAEIDLSAIDWNYHRLRSGLPEGCGFLGIVKANGYGHGSVPIALRLEALGCEYLAVASLDEAIHLRQGGVSAPILILGWTPPAYVHELLNYDLTQAIGDSETAQQYFSILNSAEGRLRVHLKLETGMGRTGFQIDDPGDHNAILELMKDDRFLMEGVFTHFAVSDDPEDPFTAEQFALFLKDVKTIEQESGQVFRYRHCSNSGAVLNNPDYACDLVRPGIVLYGLHPSGEDCPDLKPVMAVKTRIAMIRRHKKGDTISYGRTFTAEHEMRVAVVPIGYADGLRRDLSGRFSMFVGGKLAPQIGRICMDMCMLDVTDLPDCHQGDEVTVFGGQGLSVNHLAKLCGTISYELLCEVSDRVPRIYLNGTV